MDAVVQYLPSPSDKSYPFLTYYGDKESFKVVVQYLGAKRPLHIPLSVRPSDRYDSCLVSDYFQTPECFQVADL